MNASEKLSTHLVYNMHKAEFYAGILDVVKTAAAWEKIKYGIKEDDEGTFFDEDEK